MYACLLDVLHDAADHHLLAVGQCIHIHFDRVVQKPIEQHRRIVRHFHRFGHVPAQIGFFAHNFHGAAAQYITGTHHQRITDFLGHAYGTLGIPRGAVRRLFQAQLLQHFLETLAVFCCVDHVRTGADNRYAVLFQIARKFQRGLPAVLHDHAKGLFDAHNFQHVFQRQ